VSTIPFVIPDYHSLLYPIAYNLLGDTDDAADLVQETLLKWLSMEHDAIENPRGYLVKTLINKCLNHIRSHKRLESLSADADQPGASRAYLPAFLRDRQHLSLGLLALLEKLSPAERAVFMLREVFDFSHKEVADILGLTEEYCRQILRRARQRLKDDRVRFNVDEAEHQEWVDTFVEVCEGEDFGELLSLLQRDIRIEPAASWLGAGGDVWQATEQLMDFVESGGDFRIHGKMGHPFIGMYEEGRLKSWLMIKPRSTQIAEIFCYEPAYERTPVGVFTQIFC
jgi:RNA polymerase sigma factor (sigma-70 family)